MINEGEKVAVGDEVIEKLPYQRYGKLTKITKITPTGIIVLESGNKYSPNGSGKGENQLGSIKIATPEAIKEIQRRDNVKFLNNFDFDKIKDDDKLAEIIKMIKEAQ